MIIRCKNTDGQIENMVVLEKAPENLTNPNYGKVNKKTYENVEYYIDENGNVHIIKDGVDYTILPDGTVLRNGQKISAEEAGGILNALREISSKDGLVSSFVNQDDIDRNILVSTLTEEELQKLADELGIPVDTLKRLLSENPNLTVADLKNVGNLIKNLTDEELEQLAKSLGLTVDELKALLEENPDLTIDELKKIAEGKAKDKALSQESAELEALRMYLDELGITDITPEELRDMILKSGKTVGEFFDDVLKKGAKKAFKNVGLSILTGDDEPLIPKKDNGFIKLDDGTFLDPKTGKKYKDLGGGKYQEITDEDDFYKALLSGSGSGDLDMSIFEDIANPDTYVKQNGQSQKVNFLKSKQNGTSVISTKITNNMITNGTVISAVLQNGINTDIPGDVIALVSQNVYDTFTQSNILIPKGSRLIGSYDSSVSWGQNRVQIVWTSVIRPDGTIIQLNGYNGTDTLGFAGTGGSVNNHIASIIGATGLSTLITIGANYVSNLSSSNTWASIGEGIASGMGETTSSIAQKLLERVIDRQPTIVVNPGTRITVLANDNVELPIYKRTSGMTWRKY